MLCSKGIKFELKLASHHLTRGKPEKLTQSPVLAFPSDPSRSLLKHHWKRAEKQRCPHNSVTVLGSLESIPQVGWGQGVLQTMKQKVEAQ